MTTPTHYDIILIILNCYQYKDKANKQINSWLKELPDNIYYFHIIGDKDKCDDNDIYIDGHIIYTNTLDDYNSLPAKVITALKGINDNFSFNYIFKTDDDQTLIRPSFFPNICNLLKHKTPQSHYGGFILNINEHISRYWTVHSCLPKNILLKKTSYANGRFYYLSLEAVKNLITHKSKIETHYIEDHAIGLYLDAVYKENMIQFDTRKIFCDNTSV